MPGLCQDCPPVSSLHPVPEVGLGRPYLGVGQVSEGLAGLQRLQELHDGRDATLWQQHAAQAAEAAKGLLQLGRQGAGWEVLHQDHGLASLSSGLQGGDSSRGTMERRVTDPRRQY